MFSSPSPPSPGTRRSCWPAAKAEERGGSKGEKEGGDWPKLPPTLPLLVAIKVTTGLQGARFEYQGMRLKVYARSRKADRFGKQRWIGFEGIVIEASI